MPCFTIFQQIEISSSNLPTHSFSELSKVMKSSVKPTLVKIIQWRKKC